MNSALIGVFFFAVLVAVASARLEKTDLTTGTSSAIRLPTLNHVDTDCRNCRALTDAIKSVLLDQTTSYELSNIALRLCENLPSSYETICTRVAAAMSEPSVLESVLNGEDSEIVCSEIGSCVNCCQRIIDHVKVSFTDRAGEVIVQWVSREETSAPYVEYSERPLLLNSTTFISKAVHTTYQPINGSVIHVYSAALRGLGSARPYFYRCVHGGTELPTVRDPSPSAVSRELNFWSPASSSQHWTDLQVVIPVLSELGPEIYSSGVWERLSEDIREGSVSFVVHTGGLAAALVNENVRNEHLYDIVASRMQLASSYVPVVYASGDAEASIGLDRFHERFRLPGLPFLKPSDASVQRAYTSFNYGFVHAIVLSTEHELSESSEQFRWLRKDLEEAAQARDVYPWIIVFGSRPLYCSLALKGSRDCSTIAKGLRSAVESLFQTYHVDLYIAGRGPAYERMYPVYGEEALFSYGNPIYPSHVVNGPASCVEKDVYWVEPAPKWVAFRQAACGFGRLVVTEHLLTYSYVGIQTNDVIDEFSIRKEPFELY